jgi:hypothetical protein
LAVISRIRGKVLRLKNFAILIIYIVFRNIKLFTLVLIRAVSGILYLFLNIIYSKVKYLSLISRLRLIFNILIIYPR